MSYLLWQASARSVAIASPRVVLRAAEVPLLAEAQQLRDQLEELRNQQLGHIEAARQSAFAQGLAAGHEQGRIQARDELAAAVATLTAQAAQAIERLRGELAALALQVVRKLMAPLAADAQLAALAQTAAIDMLPAQNLTLAVHPDLCDSVRARLAGGTASGLGDVATPALRFEVRGDPACGHDSCRIETELGSVDASLCAQLARLAAAWGLPGDAGAAVQ
jgi:flagellar biosynthesis/type III secretory pathway protein FliH